MEADTKLILKFLKDLEKNNSLAWMKANKKEYETAKYEFEKLIQKLIDKISVYDSSIKELKPSKLIFRLNRDTRFSKDKSPYNPSFRAHISQAERFPIPAGYYLNIKPNHIFLGGGLFVSQFPEVTKMVRDEIVNNSKTFSEIIETDDFKNNFVIVGEKLKNVPKEYDNNHIFAEYLKHKAWDIEYFVTETDFVDSEKFIDLAVEKFKNMKSFNDFLNGSLVDFKMPERKK
jgi:uncharacterized protein (TIGR02453 family)